MSYFQITRASVERNKADKFIAFFESIKPQLQDIPGFVSGDIIRTAHPEDDNMIGFLRNQGNPDEDQMITIAQYDCKDSADAAQEQVRNIILPGIVEFTTSDPVLHYNISSSPVLLIFSLTFGYKTSNSRQTEPLTIKVRGSGFNQNPKK